MRDPLFGDAMPDLGIAVSIELAQQPMPRLENLISAVVLPCQVEMVTPATVERPTVESARPVVKRMEFAEVQAVSGDALRIVRW